MSDYSAWQKIHQGSPIVTATWGDGDAGDVVTGAGQYVRVLECISRSVYQYVSEGGFQGRARIELGRIVSKRERLRPVQGHPRVYPRPPGLVTQATW
jgi:hypothetical protein